MLDLADTRQLLNRHAAFDQMEATCKDQFQQFLDSVDPVTGRSATGQLTAAGWVVDQAAQRILLVYNKKLKLWLNPGGKYEPEDGTASQTMMREVLQESGVKAWLHSPLFDVSVIGLDYNRHLPCPMFDLRFFVKADSALPLNPQETDKTPTWCSLAEAKAKMPDDIQNYRLLRRTEKLFSLRATA